MSEPIDAAASPVPAPAPSPGPSGKKGSGPDTPVASPPPTAAAATVAASSAASARGKKRKSPAPSPAAAEAGAAIAPSPVPAAAGKSGSSTPTAASSQPPAKASRTGASPAPASSKSAVVASPAAAAVDGNVGAAGAAPTLATQGSMDSTDSAVGDGSAGRGSKRRRPPPQKKGQAAAEKDKPVAAPTLQPAVSQFTYVQFRAPRDKTSPMRLSDDKMTATCTKGYRMVRGSHGVKAGCWYFELLVDPSSAPGSHFRLGWSTSNGELEAPVGYDQESWAYRDVNGSKVHWGVRHYYGAGYGPGDVIGCLICLPTPTAAPVAAPSPSPDLPTSQATTDSTVAASQASQVTAATAATEDGDVSMAAPSAISNGHTTENGTADKPEPLPEDGGYMKFFKNGQDQGVAFIQLPGDRVFYPAASMYMGGTVTLNPGPHFKYPPPGPAKPMSDLVVPVLHA